MKRNQKGFSGVGASLVIVALALAGVAGWYVWKLNNESDKKSSSTTSARGSVVSKPVVDPTADWVKYSNAAGNFSFKHPKTWIFAGHPELCGEGLVLFAADAGSVGTCASENGGQMAVSSNAGDQRNGYKLGEGYTDITETPVVVDGVTGVKQSGVASGQQGQGLGGYDDGVKITQYIFYTNNKTYVATYVQQPSYPNSLTDFDTLVTKTLKISS